MEPVLATRCSVAKGGSSIYCTVLHVVPHTVVYTVCIQYLQYLIHHDSTKRREVLGKRPCTVKLPKLQYQLT